jgi:hypothetical protein
MFGQHDDQQPAAPADNQPPMDDHAAPVDNPMPPVTPDEHHDPAAGDQPHQDAPVDTTTPASDLLPNDHGNKDDLINLKQQALQQLSPLLGHLEQTPEEKFRTTMMMIQASDNADLLKEAYEAAQGIPDEKLKAQALLDVINEINYFTQQNEA